MAICAGVLALAVAGGRSWWNDEARHYRRLVYKPMAATTQLEGGTLHLTLSDPGWLRWRKLDDLLPEHGHLMHLFAVRTPELDAIAHLHPASAAPPAFTQPLPPSGALPGGTYRLFGDIVHATGLDETATASLDLPATRPEATGALDPDDAWATIPSAASAGAPSFTFPDGSGRMLWTPPARLEAGRTIELVFEVQSPSGEPVDAIEPYMGMAGHAMILARDLTIFAHVHPTGSVPMAALALVPGAAMIDHARHAGMRFPARIQFPYNFPRAGAYRVFVQIKRAGKIQTAAYDVVVGSQQP